MVFNSYEYLVFFPIVLIIYYILPHKLRWLMLLIASYFFYMCWNVKYVFLLIYVTAITFAGALIIERIKNAKIKKLVLGTTIVLGFAMLFIYKYVNFLIGSYNSLVATLLGENTVFPMANQLDLFLPMGISFYTFQATSYIIDVYRKDIKAEKNIFRYALFVSFFPQLVAGPIERTKNLMGQLKEKKTLQFDNLREGFVILLWGYFQKLVIADKAAIIVDSIYNNYQEYNGALLLFATILFAIQIYCDFSGYSLIAMGCAKMMGFTLMENFDAPYISKSVAEFWRRWHISLTSWFKDYLYIPLGGSRKGTVRKYFNKMIVFLVSGLWHGAEWSFVIWGGLNGLFQVFEEITGISKKDGTEGKISRCFGNKIIIGVMFVLRVMITFVLVDFAWIFFRADNVVAALDIIKVMFTKCDFGVLFSGAVTELGLSGANLVVLGIAISILFIADILKSRGHIIKDYIYRQNLVFRYVFYIVVFFVIVIFGTYGSGVNSTFIYFQF